MCEDDLTASALLPQRLTGSYRRLAGGDHQANRARCDWQDSPFQLPIPQRLSRECCRSVLHTVTVLEQCRN